MVEIVFPEKITLELIIAIFGAVGTLWKIIEYFLNRPKISLEIEDSNFRDAEDYDKTTGTSFHISVCISNNGSKRTTIKEAILIPFSKTMSIGNLRSVEQTKAGLIKKKLSLILDPGQTKREDLYFYTPSRIKKKDIKCKIVLIDSRNKEKSKTFQIVRSR